MLGGRAARSMPALAACGPFGSLERINFLVFLSAPAVTFLVGGQVAGPPAPFHAGVRKRIAIAVAVGVQDAVAAIAGVHDGTAFAAVERTAFLGHKSTINTRFNACTVHGDQPPFCNK